MTTRSVGKLFREVIINAELKAAVHTMLLAPSSDDPSVSAAQHRIRALTAPGTAYLFASEIRGYLEEKTRVGTEPRVFPVAGDLFLDALEINLPSMGPNLFRDHYSGMVGCYREGDCPAKTVEGPLYCVDLALQKTIGLGLTKDHVQTPQQKAPLSFLVAEDSDCKRSIAIFLGLARHCLEDAVEATLRMGASNSPGLFLNYVAEHKRRLQSLIEGWEGYHNDLDWTTRSPEEYLVGTLGVAEKAAYPPLIAMIKQHLVRLHKEQGVAVNGKGQLEQAIHPLYDAATLYLDQGNKERNASVYHLAVRRYNRAAALYTEIRDRTSTAKVLVERARAFIKKGGDPESVREGLYEAVCLVIAHIKSLPLGTVPQPKHATVIEFLENKGYGIEAEAYAEAVGLRNAPS